MDAPLRVEPRKIEFTTYGPGMAPVWSVAFALHASTGYEHRCTIIVPGHGHDDVTDVCAKAREELFRICSLIAANVVPQPDEGDGGSALAAGARVGKGRTRRQA